MTKCIYWDSLFLCDININYNFCFTDQRPQSAGQKPSGQGDPRNAMYRGHVKKPEVGYIRNIHYW